ncbi:hypothetical protein Y1Q_0018843 [Alligator mississippiensis]|uniref:Uncharacterized protein n=1 Tax=Alligator mississippiensis TaxID=8496 RepID=A0A151N4Z8_ALLMI|nr:hypothetical protein Y1Q_0018843 [Alligator mississippiensis]
MCIICLSPGLAALLPNVPQTEPRTCSPRSVTWARVGGCNWHRSAQTLPRYSLTAPAFQDRQSYQPVGTVGMPTSQLGSLVFVCTLL